MTYVGDSMTYVTTYSSPLGELVLASDGAALTGLWFQGQKYFGSTLIEPVSQQEVPPFDEVRRWLDDYFAGKEPNFTPALRCDGTPFQMVVWAALRDIPYGTTVTYGQLSRRIAERMGRDRMAAQAVGGAVGHNPISLIIPCHRVVGANGSLTGYAGGLERKHRLLLLEGAALVEKK